MRPARKHLHQIHCFRDPSRFKAILAGRRGGKTHLMREEICKKVDSCPRGGDIFYIGPTNQMAIDLIWETLLERLDQLKWKHQAKISRQCIEFSRGRKVYVTGAEKIRRVRGHKIWHALLDEVAFYSRDVWEVWRAIRPALSDLRGGATIGTTPNGKGTSAYDFYMAAKRTPGWKYFYWRTRDNPFISRDEIEDAKRELDEKSFNQEYEATWESFVGLAYYNYNESIHLKPQPPIITNVPLHLVFDFNVNPTTLLLSQFDGEMQRYKKEYSFPNSSTEDTIQAFCEDFKSQVGALHIKIRGDSAGKNRSSNTGYSDYHYVEQTLEQYGFNFDREVLPKNPAIVDRVRTYNGWLKPALGAHRVEIDPQCVELHRDLSEQELKGRHPSDKNNRGHKADASGYDIYYQNIINKDRTGQGTLYV